jgi:hypothetical protein
MNITYLLGAGASCNCLPIYNNFEKRFSHFLGFVQGQYEFFKEDKNYEDLLESLRLIQREFSFHNTPDTIAKKYFHLGDPVMLNRVKNILIIFFVYEQTVDTSNEEKQPLDKRYDAFIASLLKPIPNKIEVIENIRILTWNYDLQFELSFSKYLLELVDELQLLIQSYPKIKTGNPFNDSEFSKDGFSIIHLNGIAFPKPPRELDINRTSHFTSTTII